MNWATVTERIEHFESGMASIWVWGLTVIIAAIAAIVFHQLHLLGAIDTESAERLATVLTALALVGVFGFAMHVAHIITGTVAYFQERDES